MARRRFVASLAAASALVVLTLSACTPGKTQVSPPEDGAVPPASEADGTTPAPAVPVDDVYEQTVVWEDCGELECAVIQVPVDWSDPDGATTELAINRHVATNQSERVGSLLINPGGPGGSGLDFTHSLAVMGGAELIAHYDIVGFDPRGVGQSTPVMCGTDEQIDEFYLADVPIETQADLDAAIEQTAAFARNCRVESGAIVENVDTVSAARDMDVIRAVLGDDQLHYLGFSYGTQLGATYAQTFPENVGRLVLDGAVDFMAPSEEISKGQAAGFENSFTNFLRWCSSTDDCPLTGDLTAQKSQMSDLMQRALTDPFPTGTDWDLNGNLIVYGVVVTLYDEAAWPLLKMALEQLVDDGDGAVMYELANFYLSRDGATGTYQDNSTWAITAIRCLDATSSEPATLDGMRETQEMMEQASPTFGWWFASGVGCEGWPWSADDTFDNLDDAATAGERMLVIGTTNDPATPYEWSVSLAEQLDATLMSYDGEGHTAYGRSNQCVINAVDGFLVDGNMPAPNTSC